MASEIELRAEEFVNENIDRLIEQCENGEESMSFLAIYSFIEGYARFVCDLSWEEDWKFRQVLDELKNKHPSKAQYRAGEHQFFIELNKFHSKDENSKTGIGTNLIRHCFSKIREGSLFVVVNQFIKFAEYQGFLSEKIKKINDSKIVKKSKEQISIAPKNDSILYSQKNDLLIKYPDIFIKKQTRKNIIKRIDELQNIILTYDNEKDLKTALKEIKDNNNALKPYDNYCEIMSDYIEYINELTFTLIEARTKREYETRIIQLRDEQEEIVNNDIAKLAFSNEQKNNTKSMLIKGGPGTGKTLLLIATLFKLSENKDAVLLTYYEQLNKFINYLFGLYNQENLINKLGIKDKFSENEVNNFKDNKIKPFDDYILDIIGKSLNKKVAYDNEKIQIYKIFENEKKLLSLFEKVVENKKDAEKLYKLAVNKYWANNLTEQTYLKETDVESSKKPLYLEQIKQVSKIIEETKEYPDVYAYYKFFESDFARDRSVSCPDYILIDEVQDLTNSQIAAASHLAKVGCILAGDMNQSIRNEYVSWKELGIKIDSSTSKKLIHNYRSSVKIQQLGKEYLKYCKIRDDNKIESTLSGPPVQLYLTDDVENKGYEKSYEQIIQSIKMCTEELCISPENICIVAFTQNELEEIQKRIKSNLNLDARLVRDEKYNFEKNAGVIRLSTARAIKGIDCAVLMFFISDQSKKENQDGIKDKNRGNVIYTVVTRAMYLLQVFVPNYCKTKDYAIAGLVNTIKPEDKETEEYLNKIKPIEEETKIPENEKENVIEPKNSQPVESEQEVEPFDKVLKDVYERSASKRTDKNGNSLPNSEYGYLNIAGTGLPKPLAYGHESWPDLIRAYPDKFDFVKYPYTNGKPGYVFAFRPRVAKTKTTNSTKESMKPVSEKLYKGLVKGYEKREDGEYYLKIKSDDFDYIVPAYYKYNRNYRDYINCKVSFVALDDPFVIGKKNGKVKRNNRIPKN